MRRPGYRYREGGEEMGAVEEIQGVKSAGVCNSQTEVMLMLYVRGGCGDSAFTDCRVWGQSVKGGKDANTRISGR